MLVRNSLNSSGCTGHTTVESVFNRRACIQAKAVPSLCFYTDFHALNNAFSAGSATGVIWRDNIMSVVSHHALDTTIAVSG